ncbi:MAG: zinc ribbon domain-containing protein, partial [Nitrososphaerota archaeon]
RAEAGSAIVLAFSTIISLFLLPKVLAYYGRFTDIINARDLGVSGLIDFLGGFVPSAIGTAGVILCIIGGILGLWGKPSSPSPSLSKVQVSETEETMICPECGAINNARYKFCFKCGARLKPVKPRKTEEAVKVEQAACPVCGKTLSGDSRFCSQCGTPLSGGEQLPPPPPDIESRLEKLEERIAKLERSEGKTGQQIGEEKSKEESEAGESIFEE